MSNMTSIYYNMKNSLPPLVRNTW
uniref:Uncharacterized protein n=1 Tax=Rhizophora mucronata TaxID=61149 RepID=A0A2P2R144_RHIMU